MRPIRLSPSHAFTPAARSPSRWLKKAWRAIKRQAPLMFGIAALIWVIGAIIIALGARDLNYAAPLFAFGVVVGAFVGFAHEVERGVIDDLDGLERATHRGVTSAAPLIALRTLRGLSPDMRNPLGCAVYQPASDYAAALRHTLSTLEDARVVAVLGSTPRDGATATASSMAALAAQQGKNVLLVDCDLSRRGVTRLIDADPEAGVLEAAVNPDIWQALITPEPETGLHVMPAARLGDPWRRLFDEPRLGELVNHWRAHYDLIVLDCPPSAISAEAAMLTRVADRCLLVVSWDDTPGADVRQMMRRLRHNAPEDVNLHLNRAPAELLDQVLSGLRVEI